MSVMRLRRFEIAMAFCSLTIALYAKAACTMTCRKRWNDASFTRRSTVTPFTRDVK